MADPTIKVCRIVDTLSLTPGQRENKDHVMEADLPESFSMSPGFLKPAIEAQAVKNQPPSADLCDVRLYEELGRLKDSNGKDEARFRKARLAANPFEEIGNSIFMNRAAVKLANVDAAYGLSGSLGGLALLQNPSFQLRFCDIASGPGGFTEYLQWRIPNCRGWGMSLETDKVPKHLWWDRNLLDETRFEIVSGETGTGDLYDNWRSFGLHVLNSNVEGVDLVTADGGFDLEGPDDYDKQEFLSSRLVLCELLTALMVLSEGGALVLKVFDTVRPISAQILYVAACCFDSIQLFKPMSSRPANSERYLVALGRRESVDEYVDLLDRANKAYSAQKNVVQFIDLKPGPFTEWLKRANDWSIANQTKYNAEIARSMRGEKPADPTRYDLHKALVVWDLPDNPFPAKKRVLLRF